jgi:hypothetical protein
MPTSKFKLGTVYLTPGVMEIVPPEHAAAALCRHAAGDWGDVPPEDALANEWALANEARILSSYRAPSGERFWILTENDRSATTLLLPSEY